MKVLLFTVLLAVGVAGCLSIKSEYQPTQYYRVVQKPSAVQTVDTLPGTLYIRSFTVNEEFNNDHIVYIDEDVQQLDYYVYHRWITEVPEMISDYFANRYIQREVFRNGVAQSGSALLPEYILEAKILEMVADNREESSSVVLKISVSIVDVEPLRVERPVILQKTYEQRVARRNTGVESIPEAYSEALANIADQLLVDMENAVRYHNANSPKGATAVQEQQD